MLTNCLVANAVVLPLSAWFSRMLGRKNYYMGRVALFSLSSLLCGLAPSLDFLIPFRVLQGIAGGGLAPVQLAILVDTFPPEQPAWAFALYSMAIVTAPAIGPPIGGWITDSISWRRVFRDAHLQFSPPGELHRRLCLRATERTPLPRVFRPRVGLQSSPRYVFGDHPCLRCLPDMTTEFGEFQRNSGSLVPP